MEERSCLSRKNTTQVICDMHINHLDDQSLSALLGRGVVPVQSAKARAILHRKIILVTGAAGSIGSELCRQLLSYQPEQVIALDTNETGLFDLAESVRAHTQDTRLRIQIGDIRDVQSISRLMGKVQPHIIFHAAAYKHVPLLEDHPDQATQTNVVATYHLCRLAQSYGVEQFVFISTDKAADPESILGASKRVGELMIQAFAKLEHSGTRFCAVRFGNVLGSRGSVVPVFARQIARGGPVTVTDPDATRYFMTIPEACGLVILTTTLVGQGGLYLLDMGEPVKIVDLAMKMICTQGRQVGQDIAITYTGLRPGERLHEMLVASDEVLLPTSQSKIFCVTSQERTPVPATIAQWIQTFEEVLAYGNHEQLREHLFEIVQKQAHVSVF